MKWITLVLYHLLVHIVKLMQSYAHFPSHIFSILSIKVKAWLGDTIFDVFDNTFYRVNKRIYAFLF